MEVIPALSRRLDKRPPEVPLQWHYPEILSSSTASARGSATAPPSSPTLPEPHTREQNQPILHGLGYISWEPEQSTHLICVQMSQHTPEQALHCKRNCPSSGQDPRLKTAEHFLFSRKEPASSARTSVKYKSLRTCCSVSKSSHSTPE